MTGRRSTKRDSGAWARLVRALTRVAFVFSLFQITGAPHALAAAGAFAACVESCPCDDDGCAGDHCPPGCPDCACVHGHLSTTVPVPVPVPELTRLEPLILDLLHVDTPAPQAAHRTLERPPRA